MAKRTLFLTFLALSNIFLSLSFALPSIGLRSISPLRSSSNLHILATVETKRVKPRLLLPRTDPSQPQDDAKVASLYGKLKNNLKIDSITLSRLIEKGGFGQVWEASLKKGGATQNVAVKIAAGTKDEGALRTEAENLEDLYDNFDDAGKKAAYYAQIVNVIEDGDWTSDTEDYTMMMMKYYPDGSLGAQLRRIGKKEMEPKSEKDIKDLLKLIANALNDVHVVGKMAYRDVKPDNILLDAGRPVLADFGFATSQSKCKLKSGSGKYAAREVPEGRLYDPKLADIWSLGVLFYNLLQPESMKTPLWTGPADKECIAAEKSLENFASLVNRKDFRFKVSEEIIKFLHEEVFVEPNIRKEKVSTPLEFFERVNKMPLFQKGFAPGLEEKGKVNAKL